MKKSFKRRRRHAGFTLMEVLLVMAILVIMAGVTTVFYVGIKDRQTKNAAKLQISELEQAITMYHLTFNTYPGELQELINGPANQSQAKNFKKGEIWNKEIPVDPWGNPYVYKQDGQQFTLHSVGPNGTDDNGGGDDVKSDS